MSSHMQGFPQNKFKAEWVGVVCDHISLFGYHMNKADKGIKEGIDAERAWEEHRYITIHYVIYKYSSCVYCHTYTSNQMPLQWLCMQTLTWIR